MSALLTPRRSRPPARREKPREQAEQASLFAAAPAAPPREPAAPAAPETAAVAAEAATAAAAPAVVPEPVTTASAPRQGPTLDDLVAGAWEGLLAGAPADCFVCGAPLAPRHSAGAGIVGGRCGGCGTTVS